MILYDIRDLLVSDEKILSLVDPSRIHAYKIPDTRGLSSTIIALSPLDVPMPAVYYDGSYEYEEHLIRGEVIGPNGDAVKALSDRIQDLLDEEWDWRLTGGVDQYDDDLELFRMAKNYRGISKKSRS